MTNTLPSEIKNRLPLIHTKSTSVLLPGVTKELSMVMSERFRKVVAETGRAILALEQIRDGKGIFTFGVVASIAVTSVSVDKRTFFQATGLGRCAITRSSLVIIGTDSYRVVEWTPIADVPIPDDVWRSKPFERERMVLRGLFREVIGKYFSLYPFLRSIVSGEGSSVEHALSAEDTATGGALNKIDRATFGAAVDRAMNVFMTPLRTQHLDPLARRAGSGISFPDWSETLLRLTGEPSVLARAEALIVLLEQEIKFIDTLTETATSSGIVSSPEVMEGALGGEKGDDMDAAPKYLAKLWEQKKDRMPERARKRVMNEFDRLKRIRSDSSERGGIERYLEYLLAFPWGEYTADATDIHAVEQTLEADHWGLAKPKERIIEYISVLQLNPGKKPPILCFVGPPGVGKTSLGESIARALGRKFVRTSVGGTHDESEIRGHRRTYIGAQPGRIVSLITKAGTLNPVFMIDEIDKLGGGGFQGHPADAFLEVLDPAQNHNFVDNYLEEGVDLSQVLFIATANYAGRIPEALLDRTEIIEFSSYAETEKIGIAQTFLIPKQLAEHGLTPGQLSARSYAPTRIAIASDALAVIINEYTAEAGVRSLERRIGSIFRKIARKIREQNSSAQPAEERAGEHENAGVWEINARNLPCYLKRTERIATKHALTAPLPPGVAPMLAVSGAGGSLFYVEATYKSAQKREVKVTGYDPENQKIGTMLRESVHKALDLLFKKGGLLEDCDPKIPDEIYIHLTFANGGVPKDGPSAGIAILWALFSLFTGERIKDWLVPTGEITMALDEVYPVGGIKEKIVAALRAGAREVLIPAANLNDAEDLPLDIREKIVITPCASIVESLRRAFPGWPKWKEYDAKKSSQ